MNKTLLRSVREYKKQSFLAPFFVHDAMVNPILTNVNIPIIF